MKTTIDIPDPLYRRAKIRAVETGKTLKEIVLNSLQRELSAPASVAETEISYWANRKLRPEFKEYWESDSATGGTDSTQIISDERDGK